MRFQKAIKRMIALGTGAIMVGSSVFGAADLANFPAPFVKDGKFSGVLIVGDKAAAEDVIGISDVISSLQFAATKKVTTTSAADVTVEGDFWKVGTSAKRLELSEDLATGSSREILSNITSYIQKGDLKALDSGTVTNNKVTSPYNQYFYLLGGSAQSNMDSGYAVYSENDDDVSADFLYFKSGREIGRYLLEFTTALESDVDDSAGSSSSTGLFLTDFQDVDITMFGKKYTIVTAKRTTTTGDNVVLTLMGGAGKDTLLEKQTKTYTIGGKVYEVTLQFVDADEAQFVINGQTSRKMKDGDTDKLSDGTTIGVTDVLYQDYAGGIHSATFFIGANKLELKDTNINDLASSNALKVDDDTIDDALVTIEGSDDNSTFKISRIHINMSADDNFFVPAGGKLSETIKAEGGASAEPQVLFTQNWDIEYRGLSKETTEKVRIRTSGSSEYHLEFYDGDNNKVDLPIAKAPTGSQLLFGEQSGRALQNKENSTISKDDYVVVADSTSSRKRGERATYALQYKGADKVTADNPLLKFKNLGTGNTIEQSFSNSSVTSTIGPDGTNTLTKLATLKIGGSDFTVYSVAGIGSNDFGVTIDLNADGSILAGTAGATNSTEPVIITSKSGLEINVTNETGTTGSDQSDIVFVTFRMPDESRDGSSRDSIETLKPTVMRWNITAASAKVQMAQDTTTETNRLNLRTPSGETNIAYGYDSYGTKYTYETPTNDPATIMLEVPHKQRVPLVYITAKGASFGEVGATTTEAVTVQRIEVGAAKLASEVSNVMAQNTILVGGPCANAAAATVLGNPTDCTAGFEPGVGRIELFEHSNGNVAMLVAGYGAVDTRNAAAVVANYKDYKSSLKGTKVTVKKVNNQLTVATATA
ncbi:hypothetical protein HYW72_01305 [Candidatus Nomurabacteria bacterium]|nr:hypothetical protein [Candidatus Nomurabacteria bacterium]